MLFRPKMNLPRELWIEVLDYVKDFDYPYYNYEWKIVCKLWHSLYKFLVKTSKIHFQEDEKRLMTRVANTLWTNLVYVDAEFSETGKDAASFRFCHQCWEFCNNARGCKSRSNEHYFLSHWGNVSPPLQKGERKRVSTEEAKAFFVEMFQHEARTYLMAWACYGTESRSSVILLKRKTEGPNKFSKRKLVENARSPEYLNSLIFHK